MATVQSINNEIKTTLTHSTIEQVEQDIQRIINKLNNDGYLSKAPAAAVEKEQIKLTGLKRELAKLKKRSNP